MEFRIIQEACSRHNWHASLSTRPTGHIVSPRLSSRRSIPRKTSTSVSAAMTPKRRRRARALAPTGMKCSTSNNSSFFPPRRPVQTKARWDTKSTNFFNYMLPSLILHMDALCSLNPAQNLQMGISAYTWAAEPDIGCPCPWVLGDIVIPWVGSIYGWFWTGNVFTWVKTHAHHCFPRSK